MTTTSVSPLLRLADCGQSYWLDNLTRDMIANGELQRRVEQQGLRGITSNPATFQKAIAAGDAYDEPLRKLAATETDVQRIYDQLAVRDIQDACDILRPVFDESDGADGFVSLEVSPHLAHDAVTTIAAAHRYFEAVDRPNVMIKVPGTADGIDAIEQLLGDGVNVNITLLFSLDSYQAVANAYVRALERRRAEGRDVASVASVASFFLSRIDVYVDQLLRHRMTQQRDPARPDPQPLLGQAAIASAKLAYRSFQEVFSGSRWQALAMHGARVQRPLWASTSTKDPAESDVKYIEPLIGPETVSTMPESTIAAFDDHGEVTADTVTSGVDEAVRVLGALEALGIHLRCVTWHLQNEGVQKFIDPYNELIASLAERVEAQEA